MSFNYSKQYEDAEKAIAETNIVLSTLNSRREALEARMTTAGFGLNFQKAGATRPSPIWKVSGNGRLEPTE